MNFVVIMCDTMRPDHLGCHGNKVVRTPCLDELASQGSLFERAYCASFPTIPNRTDLFTGRYGEPLHRWAPLAWEALTLPEVMRKNGYVTMLIHDTPHLMNHGFGFDRPFHAWWMIRGNEVDRYMTDHGPVQIDFPREKMHPAAVETSYAQYLRNIAGRRTEEDYFAPKVMQAAMNWLDRNYKHEKFFLWIDSFDPHEPWDPPQHYVDLYDPGYEAGVPTNFFEKEKITPRELKHIRAHYAGEVTMVDRWIGRVMAKLEELGIADKTVVVVTSDHGTGLGDHGNIQKSFPAYEEVARIVWIVKHPKGLGAGKRFRSLVQPPDLMPTVLDMARIAQPEGLQGKSLVPVMKGTARKVRDVAISGSPPPEGELRPVAVRSERYAFMNFPNRADWQLFDLRGDPKQRRNIVKANPDVAEKLHRKLMRLLEGLDCPDWILEGYRTGRIKGKRRGAVSYRRRRNPRALYGKYIKTEVL